MNAEQTRLFDHAILRVLDRNRSRLGFSARIIGDQLAEFGFRSPDTEQMLDRLDYLTGKKLVEEVQKEIHRNNRTWRITGEGIDYLDKGAE